MREYIKDAEEEIVFSRGQVEVLIGLLMDFEPKEIGWQLGITPQAVASQRKKILKALGCRNNCGMFIKIIYLLVSQVDNLCAKSFIFQLYEMLSLRHDEFKGSAQSGREGRMNLRKMLRQLNAQGVTDVQIAQEISQSGHHTARTVVTKMRNGTINNPRSDLLTGVQQIYDRIFNQNKVVLSKMEVSK
jgi:hypothetical protein